jgi:hypothetical protein
MIHPVRKSQPTIQSAHVDAALTNLSIAYIQSQDVYIATKVFPIIPVDKQSDKYYIFNKNDWHRDEAKKRADNTESAGSGFTMSTDSYYADVWAFHKDVGSQLKANADKQVQLERASVEFVTQRLLLRQEIQWVTDYFASGVWGTDTTPTNLWSDYVNSDPVEDIEAAKETILQSTGMMANTLVLGYKTFRKLKRHPDIREQIKYTTAENVTAQLLARIFEVDRILVARAIKATNIENETAAYSFTHGSHALLCYVNPSPGEMQPSAGYTFNWTGVGGAIGGGVAIDSFDIRKTKTTRYEGEMAFDNKVTGSDLGVFFPSVVS